MEAVGLSEEFTEHFGDPHNPDPLHPDLEEYLEESEHFGQVLRHPLAYSVPHVPALNRQMNKMYEHKLKALEQARRERAWSTYCWLHERPYRLEAFAQIASELSDREYWSVLGKLWTDSENIWQNGQVWRQAFESSRSHRSYAMSTEDRKVWRNLHRRKTPLLIYRGFGYDEGEQGMSWTLSRRRAVWFARRFEREDERARLAKAVIDGYKVLAYFSTRGEEEVVIFPEDAQIIGIEEVPSE